MSRGFPSAARVKRRGRPWSLLVGLELIDLGSRQLDLDEALDDVRHVLCGEVARGAEDGEGQGEPVEDVALGVAEHLRHLARLVAVAVDHGPSGLDQVPAERVGAQTVFPAICQTGPCVWTGLVSESTRSTWTEPTIPSSSQRS